MFILNGFVTLRESYSFYFTSFSFIGISLIVAIIKCGQVLYQGKLTQWCFYLIESTVEISRVLQFIFILAIGTSTPFNELTSTSFWDKLSLSLYDMVFPDIYWDFAGFVVVFGIYNLILNLVFSPHSIARFMRNRELTRFSVESVQLALIQLFKNLLILPVGFIYIITILKII